MEKLSEEEMEWLGLKILAQVISGSIVIPKNYNDITLSDECVKDIGFAIAHIRSDEQIVQFFKQLEDHLQPFSTNGDYVAYLDEGFERQEDDACNPENTNDDPVF